MKLETTSWPGSYGERAQPRKGFFTDTSVCIGCKACEVACKEWNGVPDDGYLLTGMSYDNTQALGASTWRHVAFVEQPASRVTERGMPGSGPPGHDPDRPFRPQTRPQNSPSGLASTYDSGE